MSVLSREKGALLGVNHRYEDVGDHEDSYGNVGKPDEALSIASQFKVNGLPGRRRLRCLRFVVYGTLAGTIILIATIGFTCAIKQQYSSNGKSISASNGLADYVSRTRRLRERRSIDTHLFMMVAEPDLDFCKSIFSLLVNAYPAPRLPHFGTEIRRGRIDELETFTAYHRQHPARNDTSICYDGYDVWAQLPLDILLGRYAAMQSDMVVAADKLCWPSDASAPECIDMPQSTLPSDIYGPQTDAGEAIMARPRWLNSGAVIGRSIVVQDFWQQTLERMLRGQKDSVRNSDQEYAAKVLVTPNKVWKYVMDYRSSLFQMWGYSESDLSFILNPDPSTPATVRSNKMSSHLSLPLDDLGLQTDHKRHTSFWRDRQLLRNHVTNVIPAILHWAGQNKSEIMSEWWSHMWYMQRNVYPVLRSALEQESWPGGAGSWDAQGAWVPWADVCGHYDLYDTIGTWFLISRPICTVIGGCQGPELLERGPGAIRLHCI